MSDLIEKLQRVISILTISVHSKDAINAVHDAIEAIESKEQSIADANDQLERQRERYKELEAANRWVPVSEGLPEKDVLVLLHNDNKFMNCHFDLKWHGAGYRAEGNYWSIIGESRGRTIDSVTHWKPITPPEQSNETDS